MEEKIYFQREKVKVTDLRFTANHITVPIDKIENVIVDFKTGTLALAVTLFMLAGILIPAVCYFYGCCGWCGVVVLLASAVWLRFIYKTYVELKVSTGGGRYKLLDAGMNNRDYVFKIEDALKISLAEKQKQNP